MSLKIGGQLFAGPFPIEKAVVRANHHPAVFAIVSKEGDPWNPLFRLVDFGDTGGGLIFASHPDRERWQAAAKGALGVYLYQNPRDEVSEQGRLLLIEHIRITYRPPENFIPIHGG